MTIFFFFNDTATTEIYTLSLHDALPISCGHAGVAELRGERHRETAGVRRGEELFRIGADPILKPRAERVLRLLQHPTIRRNRALPIFQTALPNRGCFALHGFSPCASFIRFESREFDSRTSRKGIFRE